MKQLHQWIVWRLEDRPGQSKPAKVPFDLRTGFPTNPKSPRSWMSYDAAVATGHKIGFVFTETDPYFFFDLDHCLTADGWADHAVALVQRFPGAMIETSHSGDGLHVVGRYSGPRPVHGCTNLSIHGELYTAERFMAIGSHQVGDCDTDHTAALDTLVAQYFPPVERLSAADWSDGPREDWTGTTDDAELIRKARASKSVFGDSVSFEDLWTANEAALARRWPGDPYGRNDADLALARHLSFWTGCDCERVIRLMRESELVRDKWLREDYMRRTVGLAVASTDHVYDHVAPPPEGVREGYQFMAIEGQLELFAGCIYVTSRNRVMRPNGQLLNAQQFNAVVPSHEFARDQTGKGTTRKPWEALTESLSFVCPVADQICFDPTKGWDAPIERGGVTYANTYRPVETPRRSGDPGPFMLQLAKLLPDARDREIMLAYMAAVLQHKGVKFQWCPLIQGVPGNGKTLLTEVLAEAIGDRHYHLAQANDLANPFNSWLQGKILIGIEDIYVPGHRGDVLEALKPMITGGAIGIQAKGADQETARVCANLMLNSNWRDAVRKTRGDRRFAVFFTAQQTVDDLARDGMAGDYFPDLYHWLRTDGFAIMHEYLATYDIPDELNPATKCHRAPDTSTTGEAIEAGLGAVEQEILDAVAESRPGFCGGWISRTMLARWLKLDRVKLSINAQRQILTELGYVPHRVLRGRTNNPVQPDGTRAELWVLKGHLALQFEDPTSVANNYQAAQARTEEVFGDNKQSTQ